MSFIFNFWESVARLCTASLMHDSYSGILFISFSVNPNKFVLTKLFSKYFSTVTIKLSFESKS